MDFALDLVKLPPIAMGYLVRKTEVQAISLYNYSQIWLGYSSLHLQPFTDTLHNSIIMHITWIVPLVAPWPSCSLCFASCFIRSCAALSRHTSSWCLLVKTARSSSHWPLEKNQGQCCSCLQYASKKRFQYRAVSFLRMAIIVQYVCRFWQLFRFIPFRFVSFRSVSSFCYHT